MKRKSRWCRAFTEHSADTTKARFYITYMDLVTRLAKLIFTVALLSQKPNEHE